MNYQYVKRIFDFLLSSICLILILPIIFKLFLIIKMTSKGPFLHWSERVGKNGKLFFMPKIRTMDVETPQVATHLLQNPQKHISRTGSFLRKSSLDELPQIWSIFKGQMSFVGPRPALFNQNDLIELRKKNGIDKLVPGLTGWAQINGRDELKIDQKVFFDLYYLENCSFLFDLKIILMTLCKVLKYKNVSY